MYLNVWGKALLTASEPWTRYLATQYRSYVRGHRRVIPRHNIVCMYDATDELSRDTISFVLRHR